MKKLRFVTWVGASLVLLVSSPAAAIVFNDASYDGRFACEGAAAFVTASWVVHPNGSGRYVAGEQFIGGNYAVYSLDKSQSSYTVDNFGIVSETLVWVCTNGVACTVGTSYFDITAAALTAKGGQTRFSDTNLYDQTLVGSGTCSK
jgi:hypothetical protein